LLEYGEKFKVVVKVSQFDTNLAANDKFTIEVKPPVGAVLSVERYLPPALDTIMDLT